MARKKRDTGEGEPYSDREAAALAKELQAAYDAWNREHEPTKLDVRAQVEWAGHVMQANNGKRRTRVDLPPGGMRKVRQAVDKLKAATGKAEKAKPSKSLKATGWHAQLRALVESTRGSEAADRAGLNPTRRTLEKWLSDAEYNIRRGDRERIEKAYGELRDWRVTEARTAKEAAEKEAADAMTEAMRDKYGQNIRFRDIDEFRFE